MTVEDVIPAPPPPPVPPDSPSHPATSWITPGPSGTSLSLFPLCRGSPFVRHPQVGQPWPSHSQWMVPGTRCVPLPVFRGRSESRPGWSPLLVRLFAAVRSGRSPSTPRQEHPPCCVLSPPARYQGRGNSRPSRPALHRLSRPHKPAGRRHGVSSRPWESPLRRSPSPSRWAATSSPATPGGHSTRRRPSLRRPRRSSRSTGTTCSPWMSWRTCWWEWTIGTMLRWSRPLLRLRVTVTGYPRVAARRSSAGSWIWCQRCAPAASQTWTGCGGRFLPRIARSTRRSGASCWPITSTARSCWRASSTAGTSPWPTTRSRPTAREICHPPTNIPATWTTMWPRSWPMALWWDPSRHRRPGRCSGRPWERWRSRDVLEKGAPLRTVVRGVPESIPGSGTIFIGVGRCKLGCRAQSTSSPRSGRPASGTLVKRSKSSSRTIQGSTGSSSPARPRPILVCRVAGEPLH